MKTITLCLCISLVGYGIFAQSPPGSVPQIAIDSGIKEAKIANETGEYQLKGMASYYAEKFHNKTTANGETFNMNAFTAAHRTLPFNSVVQVKNELNNNTVVVRINDRGPYLKDRVIDLSKKAAEAIGMLHTGTVPVVLTIIHLGKIPPANAENQKEFQMHDIVSLQIGSYASKANADRVLNMLIDQEIQGVLEPFEDFYRVMVKDIQYKQAQQLIVTLNTIGFNDIIIRRSI